MAFKMRGFPMIQGSSPVKQNKKVQGPKTEGNVKLQPSENKDVALTGGKGKSTSEKIADYEDRIEFIKEDIFNAGKATPQQNKDLAKLEQELAILKRGTKKPPFKKKNTIKENKFDVDKLADKDDQRFLDKQREERVKYSELDDKGKAIYNKNKQKNNKPDQSKFSDLEKYDDDRG